MGVTELAASAPYRIGSGLFHSLLARTMGYSYPRMGTTFIIMSRRLINAVTRVRRFDHRLIARIYNSGYKIQSMRYQAFIQRRVKGRSKRTFRTAMRIAYLTIIFNSLKPLRFINFLGIAGTLLAFLFALYSILVNIVKAHVQEGWTTQVLFTSAMFFILFVVLSVLGEYVARLIEESDPGSDYEVLFERHSSTMIDTERKNVFRESVSEETNWAQTGRDH